MATVESPSAANDRAFTSAGERRGQLGLSAVLSTTRVVEQALLGCVLVDDFEVWGELLDYPVVADDFFFPEHKALWRAFLWLHAQGMEVTTPGCLQALQELNLLDSMDNWVFSTERYLVELWGASYSAKGCGSFLRMVKHYSDMRAPVSVRKGRELPVG